ncbi:MAG: hypothetical protein K0U60_01630 [Actinomycetia bacterium]|nr:hypothetical protein [Actinomycetes bacterium]MCH9800681.1 hypothetical protein [Actinomycetes bacterium]
MPSRFRAAAVALGSGALVLGALVPMTTTAATAEEAVPEAPAAAQQEATPQQEAAPSRGDRISGANTWDWSMPAQMTDEKKWVACEAGAAKPDGSANPFFCEVGSPEYYAGGQYIDGKDGIPDDKMKKTKWSKDSGYNRYGPLPKNGKYKVMLDGSTIAGPGKLTCTWIIQMNKKKTIRVSGKAKGTCPEKKKLKLPEGNFKTKLQIKSSSGSSVTGDAKKLKVKNHLMVIMGDSYSSGEGFPPFYKQNTDPNFSNARWIDWDDNRCHRSRWAGQVRAALEVEKTSPRSNVTLVDVACTGAQVSGGNLVANQKLLGDLTGQGGILHPQKNGLTNGVDYGYTPAQIDQAHAALRNGKLVADTVSFTIGGNDVLFYPLVVACGISGASTLINELPEGVLEILAGQLAGLIIQNDPSAGTQEDVKSEVLKAVEASGKQNCYGAAPAWELPGTQANPAPETPGTAPLWAIIQRQLLQLDQRYDDMAKCIKTMKGTKAPGKNGKGCKTYALQNGVSGPSASSPSKSKPIKVAKAKNVVQGIYPDLTSGEKGELLEKTVQPCEWSVEYPADTISNYWAYNVAYVGQKGKEVPMPNWQKSDLPYKGANPVIDNNTYTPTITPEVDGIKGLIQENKADYGWTPELKMLSESRGHGGCAGSGSWLFPATSAAGASAPAPYNNPPNGSGAMHPNDIGQEKYAEYMGAKLLKRTGVKKESK